MTQAPLCKICNSPVTKFVKSSDLWWSWCSNKCMGRDPDILKKKAETNAARFGSHPMRNSEIIAARKVSFQEKYGSDNPFGSAEIQKKIQSKLIQTLGVDNPSKNPEIVKKIQTQAILRYASSTQKEALLAKRQKTNLKRFGNISNKLIHISDYVQQKMNNLIWLEDQHLNQKKSLECIAKELGITAHPLRDRFQAAGITIIRHSSSSIEQEIKDFLKTLTNQEIISSSRNIIPPQELDLYIPSQKLAIEINGVYWHSETQGKTSKYHLQKTKNCELNGIQLLHIYDNEWTDVDKQNIIKSKLAHLFGKSYRISARKCTIQELPSSIAGPFLMKNHLQGTNPARVRIGLYENNELCAVATFGVPRFNKNFSWELLRYANRLNCTVVGGLSKILAYFVKTYDVKNMISYADRRWSSSLSNVYQSLGFVFQSETAPNYKYFLAKNHQLVLMSRNKFQKHKLASQLKIFDENLTYENEWISSNLGLR